MKCRFKTNKILTAANETKHTITTTDGKVIHKKLASGPLNFSQQRKQKSRGNPPTDAPDAADSATMIYATHTKESVPNNRDNQRAHIKQFPQCQSKGLKYDRI